MTQTQLWISFIIMSIMTIITRFLPFFIFKKNNTPKWVEQLGKTLPYAVIGMLVVYCLKGVSFTQASTFIPECIAVSVVVISYVWKKNSVLSVLVGTLVYMLLVQFIFI